LLLDARASIEAAPGVAALLAGVLGRDAAWQTHEVAAFTEFALGHLTREALAADLPPTPAALAQPRRST
jgi:glycerol-3-phosphate dehydrogenase